MTKNELNDIWEQALYILEKKLNKHSFDTWIKPIKPLRYFNNRLVIETPNNFSKSWLSERYAPLVKSVFEDILQQATEVQFVISGEKIEEHNPPAKTTRHDYEESIATHFNPRYTFDSFVVGNSNRFAHAACLAVAELPAKAYNHLFIYGG
ncbi:MAG: chromosomal replication initiator protein DnaA, partial [Candidatus Methanofastidiosa archaeon]|nr:chromosomal replication initiator protein DnaA [Candidatus Methanofastidiosa archaeon]